MSRVLVHLVRIAVILIGFMAAAFAAGLFFSLLVLGAAGRDAAAIAAYQGPIWFSVPFFSTLFAYHSFAPALAAILLAELLGRRDWLFHALGGAAVTAAAVGLAWRGGSGPSDVPALLLLAACGMVGGIAYWAVAGRSSGVWLHGPTAPGPSGS